MTTAPTAKPVTTANACDKCGGEKTWRDCWNCEEGFSHHDCGEDCCVCLHPEDNVRCDVCRGKGGFLVCDVCYPPEDM